jgi:hypothetical protein
MKINRLNANRRIVTIGGVAVLLLALAGYAFWSNATWASYHASYGRQKDEMKASVDTALKMPASSTKERAAKLKAIASASRNTSDQDKLCTVNGMVGWQQAVNGSYKKWQQECESTQASINSLNDGLQAVTAYMESDQALAGILSTALASTNKKVTESSFSSVLSKWKNAATEVKGMHVSATFAPVKAKAQKAVSGVESAWQALITAHAAKDEAKYEKALKSLSGAYSAIASIEQECTKQVTQQSKTVQSLYDVAL